jgi:hypothetical protein
MAAPVLALLSTQSTQGGKLLLYSLYIEHSDISAVCCSFVSADDMRLDVARDA